MDEWLERVASREPVELPSGAGAQALQAAREDREARLDSL